MKKILIIILILFLSISGIYLYHYSKSSADRNNDTRTNNIAEETRSIANDNFIPDNDITIHSNDDVTVSVQQPIKRRTAYNVIAAKEETIELESEDFDYWYYYSSSKSSYNSYSKFQEAKISMTDYNFIYGDDEDIMIKADDGVGVIFLRLAKIDDMYKLFIKSNRLFPRYDFVVGNEDEGAVYLVLCPDKKHVLLQITAYNTWLDSNPKIDYNFSLVKLHEYTNVTTYSFSTYDHFSTPIWLAKNHGGYCGGLDYYPMPLSIDRVTARDMKFYDYIKDAYIGIVNDEIKAFNKALDNYREYIPPNMGRYIRYITLHDKKVGDELKNRYNAVINRKYEYTVNSKFYNNNLLLKYNAPIWQITKEHELDREDLPLKGGLPTNEEELVVYIAYVTELYADDDKILKDAYGEPVKFTLEKNGLRVSSSGFDKKWNTPDDQTNLSKYEDIDRYRLPSIFVYL